MGKKRYEDEFDGLEDFDEVPLEYSDEETETILDEEGALDGTMEEVEKVAKPKQRKKKAFELTPPADLEDIVDYLCARRRKRLRYDINDGLFYAEFAVEGTDGKNYEGIKISRIIDAEIKEGVKKGRIAKYDGLKGKELKEEYAGDRAYEYAGQELCRGGLLLNGETIEVYVFDWDIRAFHHVGYISGEKAEELKPYLEDSEKYTYDVNLSLTGGRYKKIVADENGKLSFEKGDDGAIGLYLDVTVLNRID